MFMCVNTEMAYLGFLHDKGILMCVQTHSHNKWDFLVWEKGFECIFFLFWQTGKVGTKKEKSVQNHCLLTEQTPQEFDQIFTKERVCVLH